jgi:hypothetical protein
MRRTPLLIAAVSLVAAATPAALLAHPSDVSKGKGPEVQKPVKAKTPKGTLHLANACVVADARSEGDAEKTDTVDLKVLSANRHMRDVLGGGPAKGKTFTADITGTAIRLVGKARFQPDGGPKAKLPKVGTWENLEAGDFVTVRYRVKRGTALADIGSVWKLTDRGPFPKKCPVPVPDPKPETPPATETPTPSL